MPQTYTEKREEARKMYVESGGNALLKDIAAKLEVPRTTLSGWKKVDKWDKQLKKKPKSHRRAPKGNQYASGPHPSMAGNQSNFKHGRYSQLKYDTMSEEEKAIIEEIRSTVEQDQIDMQKNLIGELEVRERRMYSRIQQLQKEAEKLADGLVTDYIQTSRKGVTPKDNEEGKSKPIDIIQGRKRADDKVQEIENALTGVQKQKQAAINALHRMTEDKTSREIEKQKLEMEQKRIALMERRLALVDPDVESDAMREAREILGGIDSVF